MTTTARAGDTTRLRQNYRDELESAALYDMLAGVEDDDRVAEVYRRLAVVERRHAESWGRLLHAEGEESPSFSASWRTRTLGWLARRFGTALILPTVASLEEVGAHEMSVRNADPGVAVERQANVRLLREVTGSVRGGLPGEALVRIEGRHRSVGGNALRAAVLGSNDGIVSNLSLVMGVAGAELAGRTILITGLAGLLAGACSMGLGEWLSVQSSRELFRRQIETEQAALESDPEAEAEGLSLIYQARGLEPEQAGALARRIVADRAGAVQTVVREKLGLDPHELGGSAWVAAITSLLLFSFGAVMPVIPFTFLTGLPAVVVSVLAAMIVLFGIGAATTLFTGRGMLFAGGRQAAFGLAAALLTYAIGRAIGVSIGG